MPLNREVHIINRTILVQFLREKHPFKKRTSFSYPIYGAIAWKLLENVPQKVALLMRAITGILLMIRIQLLAIYWNTNSPQILSNLQILHFLQISFSYSLSRSKLFVVQWISYNLHKYLSSGWWHKVKATMVKEEII